MPLNSRMVGETTEEITHSVDARWLTDYATCIGDHNPPFMDSTQGPILAHPMFPVCLEWPAILSSRELPGHETVGPEEAGRGVHAAHDLHIHQPIIEGESYTTQAQIVSLSAIRPGAVKVTRLDTRSSRGKLVCQTWHTGISRGVAIEGEPGAIEPPPAPPDLAGAQPQKQAIQIPVAEGLSYSYTESARIESPIHTDREYARAAGLPDIILHGTATLALGVTALVNSFAGGDPARVERIGGRFSGIVLMPNTLTLEVTARAGSNYGFRLLDRDGAEVFSAGYITFRS
jgi:acyl dehydratase